MKLLCTIDREDWKPVRQREVWRREWWLYRFGRFQDLPGIGRTVFQIDLPAGKVTEAFSLPQLLPREVLDGSFKLLDTWGKILSRGLRTIKRYGDGFVISDVSGIYRTDAQGKVLDYLTSPRFSDLHSAVPDEGGIWVSSTGTEELLRVAWDGSILSEIQLADLFGTQSNNALDRELASMPDRRLLRLDNTRHCFHVNWAEPFQDTQLLISCHTPGIVAIIEPDDMGHWHIVKQFGYFPHCHRPVIDPSRGTFYVCVSRTDQVRAVCLQTGKELWRTQGIRYGKGVELLGTDHLAATDCNGKRIAVINRTTGALEQAVDLPGIPYCICLVE